MPPRTAIARCGRCVTLLAASLIAIAAMPAQDPPTVAIEGRVVDLLGGPLPLAEIRVTSPGDDTVLVRLHCDGEGRFRLGRVPQREVWHVRAALPGYAHESMRVTRESHRRFLEFELAEAARCRGTLCDARGVAVRGAVVRALALSDGELPRFVDAVTDAGGRFDLPDVGLGANRLVASVPDAGFVALDVVVTGGTDNTDVVLSAAPQPLKPPMRVGVTGVATADLPSVALHCAVRHRQCLLPLPPPHESVPFAADGTLTLIGAYDGPLAVTPAAPGYVFSPRTRWLDKNQSLDELTFEAFRVRDPGLACRAVVRQTDGSPLPGIDLAMELPDGTVRTVATSDRDGALVFHSLLPPGEKCVVRSLSEDWLIEPILDIPGRHADRLRCATVVQPRLQLSLRACRSAVVQGRIVAVDGRPASGFTVVLEEQMPGAAASWTEVASAITDAAGNCRCTGIHPESGQLRLRIADPRGVGVSDAFVLGAGEVAMASCDLQLEPAATVAGIVRDVEGRPVAGVAVKLLQHRGRLQVGAPRRDMPPARITDRRGRFRFPLTPVDALIAYTTGARSEPFQVEAGGRQVVELTAKQ